MYAVQLSTRCWLALRLCWLVATRSAEPLMDAELTSLLNSPARAASAMAQLLMKAGGRHKLAKHEPDNVLNHKNGLCTRSREYNL